MNKLLDRPSFWFRLALFFALLFVAGYARAQVMVQWGQDASGTNRTVYVLNPVTNVEVPIGSFNTSTNAWVGGGTGGFNISEPFPTSFGATPTDLASINVGGFPASSQIPQGVPEGLAVLMNVPASYTSVGWPATAISAYSLSANTNQTGIGNSNAALFGFSGSLANFVNPYGGNLVCSNSPTPALVASTGFDFSGLTCLELNPQVIKKAGGVQPHGNVFALKIIGGGEVAPIESSQAIDIFQLGVSVLWGDLIKLEPGSGATAIEVGATAASGSSLASMPIKLDSVDSSAGAHQGSIFANAFQQIVINPTAFLNSTAGNTLLTVGGQTSTTSATTPSSIAFDQYYSPTPGLGQKIVLLGTVGTAAFGIDVSPNQFDFDVPSASGFGWYVSAAKMAGLSAAGLFNAISYSANGTAGVTCAGSPTASFAATSGIVTHC